MNTRTKPYVATYVEQQHDLPSIYYFYGLADDVYRAAGTISDELWRDMGTPTYHATLEEAQAVAEAERDDTQRVHGQYYGMYVEHAAPLETADPFAGAA